MGLLPRISFAKNAFAALNEVSAYARGVRVFAGEISEKQWRESHKSNTESSFLATGLSKIRTDREYTSSSISN